MPSNLTITPPECKPNAPSDASEPWRGADLLRITRQVQRLHDIGPRATYEFLKELAADPLVHDDIDLLLPHYCRLDPGTVKALDARDLRLPIAVIENGEIRQASAR